MIVAFAIARKELRVYFSAMWGWAFLAASSFLSSFAFWAAVAEFQGVQGTVRKMGGWAHAPTDLLSFRNLTDGVLVPMASVLTFVTLLFSAMIAARLIAEERKQKSFELLLTSPIRTIDIVLGKYLGGLGIVLCIALSNLLYPSLLTTFGSSESGHAVDWGVVFTGFLALVLVGSSSLALGLFISSLTDSVLVSAMVSGTITLLWILARTLVPNEEPLRSLVTSFMFDTHVASLVKGLFELKTLVFFLSLTTLFLMLTHRSIESQRWG